MFNILDLAGINARILYKETMKEKISRQEVLFQLVTELGTVYKELQEKNVPKPSMNTSSDSNV